MRRQFSTFLAVGIGVVIVILSALFSLLENSLGH